MHAQPDSRVTIQTSWGDVRVTLQGGRLRSLELPCLMTAPNEAFDVNAIHAVAIDSVDERLLRELETFMQAVFSGQRTKPVPYIRPAGTKFCLQVWGAISRIPSGKTRSYGELARGLGKPGAARAVGRACGANPLPLVIPCHRVVAASGALGGFSCGLAWKKLLLEIEKTGR